MNDATHRKFQQILVSTDPYRHIAADHLRALGYVTHVPELEIAPSRDVREQYSDDGDILFVDEHGQQQNIEVKTTRMFFYPDMENWPFDYGMFVNTVDRWHRYKQKPTAIFIFSTHKQATADLAAVIDVASSEQFWTVRNTGHKHFNQERNRLCCPLEYIQTIRMLKP